MTEDLKTKIEEPAGYSSDVEELHKYGVLLDKRLVTLESDNMSEDGGELGVCHSMAMRFLKNLALCQSSGKEKDPITVILNTNGGDVAQGFAIYDAIKHSSCPVIMKVYGACMSMGSIILQAASCRILSENSSVMFHHGTPGFIGGENSFEVVNRAKFEKYLGDRADKIVMDAINKKRKKNGKKPLSYKKFQEINLMGRYIFPEEALDLGLADFIITDECSFDICDNEVKI